MSVDKSLLNFILIFFSIVLQNNYLQNMFAVYDELWENGHKKRETKPFMT